MYADQRLYIFTHRILGLYFNGLDSSKPAEYNELFRYDKADGTSLDNCARYVVHKSVDVSANL